MFEKIRVSGKKSALLMIAVALFMAFGGFCLHAGPCEDGLARCMAEMGWTSPLYCGVGWVFCKKYIE